MQEAISAHKVGGIVSLTGFIIRMTLVFELAGALVMAPAFCRELGMARGLWYALFHSISAFCNAGFDLMGIRSPYSSLTCFVEDPWINVIAKKKSTVRRTAKRFGISKSTVHMVVTK